MMRFKIQTVRREERLTISVDGDVLTLNDETLDFSFIEEGGILPEKGIDNYWVGPGGVERIDGEITLTLIVPYGRNPPDELLDPPSEVVWGEDWTELPPYGDPLDPTQQ